MTIGRAKGRRRRQRADKEDFGKMAIFPLQRLIDSGCLSAVDFSGDSGDSLTIQRSWQGERNKQTSKYGLHA